MIEARVDGVLVYDGHEAVKLTSAGDRGLIVVTGKTSDHPFNSLPALLSWGAVQDLYDVLGRFLARDASPTQGVPSP